MTDSIQLMFTFTVETLTQTPRLTIVNANMDDNEDPLHPVTGKSNRQLEDDSTLTEASTAKMYKTRNKTRNQSNPEPNERPTLPSQSTNG